MSAQGPGSPLRPRIDALVAAKRAMGFDASNLERRLLSFDAFCEGTGLARVELTREMGLAWLEPREGESSPTVSLRASALRQLSGWLAAEGVDAWAPPHGFAGDGRSRFAPYIYDDSEIDAFFDAADRLPRNWQCPLRGIVAPTMFRLMLCCGLRPQEATGLRADDLDAGARALLIFDSKRRRDRVVPMAPDVAEMCAEYDRDASRALPGREWLFESGGRPGRLDAGWVQRAFWACWREAGVTFGDRRPRPYDWRHNHATRVVAGWMDAGLDVWNLLPRLSAYLGHASLESTARYVHLVPSHAGLRERASWACPPPAVGG